jgi:O-Antigen ligase
MGVQHSRYPLQYAAYGICVLLMLLDGTIAKRAFAKPLVPWMFATLLLLTWAVVIRTFKTPVGFSDYAGYTDYFLLREFGVRANSLGFLLTCVVIFDDPHILRRAKQAIVIVTIASVPLVIFDALQPGIFSDIPGRGAGLYMQPNSAGMALVFGSLIGLTVIRHRWQRELFVLYMFAGVLATFSREAVLSFGILLVVAMIHHTLSASRVLTASAIVLVMLPMLSVIDTSAAEHILNSDAWARVTFQWSDTSTKEREELLANTMDQFEKAPVLGQGFGTTDFWEDLPVHNSYLDLMTDCGLLGLFVIPGLVFAIRRRSWDFYAFAVIYLFWGLFNHQLLTELYALITIAIQADEPHPLSHLYPALYIPSRIAY